MYGKPVISGGGPQQPENPYSEQRHSPDQPSEVDHGAHQGPPTEGQQGETERTPRPLSPTKLLPFISNPYRHQSDGDLEALRKKLYNAPRPLKKRSSITEPEGPAGPNIQKLLYQKTTLAAMETILTTPTTPEAVKEEGGAGPGVPGAQIGGDSSQPESVTLEACEVLPPSPNLLPPLPAEHTPPPAIPKGDREEFTPPPHPAHPAPRPDQPLFPAPTPVAAVGMEEPSPPSLTPPPESFTEEFPPYPPPPYPSGAGQESLGEDTLSMQAPEVTGQVTLPPVRNLSYTVVLMMMIHFILSAFYDIHKHQLTIRHI